MQNSCRELNKAAWPGWLRGRVYYYAQVEHKSFQWIWDNWEGVIDPDETRIGMPNNEGKADPASIRRWMKGENVPKDEKERVLYGDLRGRYWFPQGLIDHMIKARDEGSTLETSDTYQERYEQDRQQFDRVCIGGPWDATQIQFLGGYLIFGARTIDDFSTQLVKLLEKYNIRITDDSAEFVRELQLLVGVK